MVTLALASFLLPFIGGALALAIPRGWVKVVSQIVAGLAFACSLVVLIGLANTGQNIDADLVIFAGKIVVFGVIIDQVSAMIGLAVSLVGFLIVVYSTGYLSAANREHPESEVKRRYYIFLLAFIGSMMGLIYSSTMLGLLWFFELTGVCSWALIGYFDDLKARRAALKAIITTQVAALGLYIATAILFGLTGMFKLTALAGLADDAKTVIFAGVLIASWGKSAQLPFHFWLPDAMAAPTPISAYLHAASMVKVGVYVLARCLISAGSVPTVIGVIGGVMAVLTMVYAFLMYFPQKDLKRLLAYSTITQISYIFLALSVSIFGSRLAFNGAVAHIFNHAFGKSLFFLVAGALGFSTGTRMIPSLKGIMGRMPLVGGGFLAATLAVTGVPPFNGFFSKFSILAGAFMAGQTQPLLLLLVAIAVVESIGSFAWLFWIAGSAVTGEPSAEVAASTRLAPQIQVALAALICLTLVSGVWAMNWLS